MLAVPVDLRDEVMQACSAEIGVIFLSGLIDLRARSFLLRDNQTTWGWAKVFLKALVE